MNRFLRYYLTIISLLIFQITLFGQFSAQKDNTLYEDVEGMRSNGQGEHFFAGRTGGEGPDELRRGLIAFDIAGQVPEGATITSVVLRLNMSRSTAGPVPVSLHRVLKDWGEADSDAPGGEGAGTAADTNDVTWLHTFFNSQFWTNPGGDFDTSASASQSVSGIGFYTWGSTEQMVDNVQTWLDSPSTNYGWLVKGDESSPTTAKRFDSRENANVNNRPVLQVNFTLPNVPPVAVDDSTGTNEDIAVIVDVLANDSDSDGTLDPASVTIVDNPTGGAITNLNTTTGAVTYDPTTNFNGEDSFTYTVEDDDGATSDTARVIINVDSENDPPVIAAIPPLSFNEDDTLTTPQSAWQEFISDPDDDVNSLSYDLIPGSYVSVVVDSFNIVLTAPENWFGSDTLTLIVSDGQLADTARIFVTVNPVNDAPVFLNLPDSVSFDNSTELALVLADKVTDADLPGDSLRWSFSVSNDSLQHDFDPQTQTLTVQAPNFTGHVTLTITVTDDSTAGVSDSIWVEVTETPNSLANFSPDLPQRFELAQNYPNPFNPTTRIRFSLPRQSEVVITIFDLLGKKVDVLVNRRFTAGVHILEFDGSALTSGIYFYMIEAGPYRDIRKMILVK